MNPIGLKEKEKKYQQQLTEKRLLLGKADGAMESSFPSGRFELESDIKVLEILLAEIKQEIAKLQMVQPSLTWSDPLGK